MRNSLTAIILSEVFQERQRQDAKWGLQRHELGKWLAILAEEFGEVAQAMQGPMGLVSVKPTDASDLYQELIHVAAVAVAIAEQVREQSENVIDLKGENIFDPRD